MVCVGHADGLMWCVLWSDGQVFYFEDNCVECQQLKKRIEKFLGEETVNEIKKSISKKI